MRNLRSSRNFFPLLIRSGKAAQRLLFLLDFGYATGVRPSELIAARLGDIETDGQGDEWLKLTGKGGRSGKVALPPLARRVLERYLSTDSRSVGACGDLKLPF